MTTIQKDVKARYNEFIVVKIKLCVYTLEKNITQHGFLHKKTYIVLYKMIKQTIPILNINSCQFP